MEVLEPEAPSFRFGIADSLPYTSSPLSPNTLFDPLLLLHHFTSAPASPSDDAGGSNMHDEFAFNNIMLQEIVTADKLFDKGRIRPLKLVETTFSSRSRRRRNRPRSVSLDGELFMKHRRGSPASSSAELATKVSAKGGASKKWIRLKNLFPFRSASEGRAVDRVSKPPLIKFTLLTSVSSLNKQKRSVRSTAGTGGDKAEELAKRLGGGGGAGSAVSALEMFYKANKAAAKERRRKTPLPYQRNGLYTCFNPTQSRHSWLLR